MIKSNKLIYCLVIFLNINIFFSYLIKSDLVFLIISAVCAIVYLLVVSRGEIRISYNLIALLILFAIFTLSSLTFENIDISIKYPITILILLFVVSVLENSAGWENVFFKFLELFSGIHVLCTLLYLATPNFITNICSRILSDDLLIENSNLFNQGANPGITGQTGLNSVFITCFIIIQFSKIIIKREKKNRFFPFCLFMAGVVALLLTERRGSLIANIVAILFVLLIQSKNAKKYVVRIIEVSICAVLAYFLITHVINTNTVFNKIEIMRNADDFTSGRISLIKDAWSLFFENPIFGAGFRYVFQIGRGDFHNVYLQLLAENGVVAFAIYIFIIISNLVFTIKECRVLIRSNSKNRFIIISLYYQVFYIILSLAENCLYDFRQFAPYVILTVYTHMYVRHYKKYEIDKTKKYKIKKRILANIAKS